MNQASYPTTPGMSGLRGRNTFGWRPTVKSSKNGSYVTSPNRGGLSTPVSSPVSYGSTSKSLYSGHTLSNNGNNKRNGHLHGLPENATPNTKPLLHTSKKGHSEVSTPNQGSRSTPASEIRSPSIINQKRTPTVNKRMGTRNVPNSNSNQPTTSSSSFIKKAASSPVFTRGQSKVEISREFLDRLNSKDLVELTIQPERAAMSQCLAALNELEALCNETAVMKVAHPTSKMKERINDLDQIVDNARNVIMKVVAIYRE